MRIAYTNLEAPKMRFLFLIVFFFLAIVWLLAWAAFHVAGGLIHVLLVLAVISLLIHLFRGSTA
jgi:hypothetical protein